jgi:CRISPR-associated protein Csb3
MNKSSESICINVDPTNPGQFFACCGLLELATRIDSNSLARFEDGKFVIDGNVGMVLGEFFKCNVDVDTSAVIADEEDDEKDSELVDPYRGRVYPMLLGEPFNLRLDWWTDQDAQDQKLKTWTAGQRITDLLLRHHKKSKRNGKVHLTPVPSMRDHFANVVRDQPDNWLRSAVPIEAPMAFSYDSRLSRNNALDLGHTEWGILAFSPAVDVLTVIGLQRFRPRMITKWSRNAFCTWREPIPVEIAAVVSLGVIPQLSDSCYEFPIIRRDSQGRFKLFGHAQPARRPHDGDIEEIR